MKIKLILAIALLSSCSTYRIQVNTTTAGTYYKASQRVDIHWVEHYSMFSTQQQAEKQIQEWKDDKAFKKANKSQYIYFK
jgi:hypothetical protein